MSVKRHIRTTLGRALLGGLVAAGSLGLAAPGADASGTSGTADAALARPDSGRSVTTRPGTLLYQDGAVKIYGCASLEPTGFGELWHVILTTSKPAGVTPAFVNGGILNWAGQYTPIPTSDLWWGDVVNAVDMWAVSRGDFVNWSIQVWVVNYVGSAMVGNLDSC